MVEFLEATRDGYKLVKYEQAKEETCRIPSSPSIVEIWHGWSPSSLPISPFIGVCGSRHSRAETSFWCGSRTFLMRRRYVNTLGKTSTWTHNLPKMLSLFCRQQWWLSTVEKLRCHGLWSKAAVRCGYRFGKHLFSIASYLVIAVTDSCMFKVWYYLSFPWWLSFLMYGSGRSRHDLPLPVLDTLMDRSVLNELVFNTIEWRKE